MNFQQLQYVVTIQETGSFSAAAKMLFMGQPNLSKSIKDLETEIGIEIFNRTSKGVTLTTSGVAFVDYAKSILKQMDQLESLYTKPKKLTSLSVSVPRATYISTCLSKYMHDNCQHLSRIAYTETNPIAVISNVSNRSSNLGIVRYEITHENYFMSLISENNLSYKLIKEYSMVIMVSKNHPLANESQLSFNQISSYTEIVQGDLKTMFPAENSPIPTQTCKPNQIEVLDRGSQFDFLRQINGSYMWVSPVPQEQLDRHGMVLIPCPTDSRYKDVAIYRKHSQSLGLINAIIDALKDASNF